MATITAPIRWLAIMLIKIYKVTISPMIGPRCRFEPSCSTYAIEAIKMHGLIKGCWLTSKRLIKCQPLNPGGYDPVPDPKQHKSD